MSDRSTDTEHSIFDEDTSPDVTGEVRAIVEPGAEMLQQAHAALNDCAAGWRHFGETLRIRNERPHLLVLVVDDLLDHLTAMAVAVGQHGIDIDGAVNAADAMHKARNLAMRGKRYDAAVLDIVLPGTSGPELAKNLRGLWPTLPVILVSGHEELLEDAAADCAADAWIAKPFDGDDLMRAIAGVVPKARDIWTPQASR